MQDHIFDGEMLTDLRERARMSVGYLAEKTGLNPLTIEKLELGETTNPHLNTVKRLAETLNVPGAMFYTLPDYSGQLSQQAIRHLKVVINDLRNPQRLSGLKAIKEDLVLIQHDIDDMINAQTRTGHRRTTSRYNR